MPKDREACAKPVKVRCSTQILCKPPRFAEGHSIDLTGNGGAVVESDCDCTCCIVNDSAPMARLREREWCRDAVTVAQRVGRKE